MGQANINRGEKWSKVLAIAVFENRQKDVEWINTQQSILKDIEEYKISIEPKEEPKEKKEKK